MYTVIPDEGNEAYFTLINQVSVFVKHVIVYGCVSFCTSVYAFVSQVHILLLLLCILVTQYIYVPLSDHKFI